MIQIPPQNIEIEQIYTRLLSEKKQTITVCSANQGEGVTSIAVALAHRNLLAGQSTLLVDLNLYKPSINTFLTLELPENRATALDSPQLVTVRGQQIALMGIPSPTRREMILKLRKPGVLEQFIEQWKKSFDTIIFDTSPINRINANNIPAERVIAASNGCLLVVLAGHTTDAMVSTAIDKINTSGGRLLGCVYNDRDTPLLKDELIRETHRLEPHFNSLGLYLRKWIQQSRLLNLEI